MLRSSLRPSAGSAGMYFQDKVSATGMLFSGTCTIFWLYFCNWSSIVVAWLVPLPEVSWWCSPVACDQSVWWPPSHKCTGGTCGSLVGWCTALSQSVCSFALLGSWILKHKLLVCLPGRWQLPVQTCWHPPQAWLPSLGQRRQGLAGFWWCPWFFVVQSAVVHPRWTRHLPSASPSSAWLSLTAEVQTLLNRWSCLAKSGVPSCHREEAYHGLLSLWLGHASTHQQWQGGQSTWLPLCQLSVSQISVLGSLQQPSGVLFEVCIMVLPSCARDNDIVHKRCDYRDAFKDFIHLLLEVILGTDNSKAKSAELVAAKGRVKSGEVQWLLCQFQLPVTGFGIQLAGLAWGSVVAWLLHLDPWGPGRSWVCCWLFLPLPRSHPVCWNGDLFHDCVSSFLSNSFFGLFLMVCGTQRAGWTMGTAPSLR